MRSEMDLMRMDERQRLHWLRANRATLMVVGVVWLLMIAFELSEQRTPGFLIVMVPIFAGIRFGFYYYYARDRDVRWVERVLFVVLVGFGHWVATATAWVGEFSTSGLFGLFPEEPAHSAWVTAIDIFEFPLVTFVRHNEIDQSGWANVLMILNSALWAGAAYLVVWAARRRRVAASEGAAGVPR
ncbi:MAG: hypothetical protein KAW67_05795 [Candidatus Eisenbacteria sp.]|nr:hypothetical protein [Candidatus Eisenbacteria bacterium]